MQTIISKIICFIIATAGYLLAIYVVVPWIVSLNNAEPGFKVTDVVETFRFEYIIGCIIACTIWLILSSVLANIAIKAWCLGGCALVTTGIIIIMIAGWEELTKESKLIPYVKYHDNGVVSERGKKVRGKKNGKVTKYYKSGDVKATEMYVKDEPFGECEIFYKNGQLMAKGIGQGQEWLDYERVPIFNGEWIFYRADGSVDDVRVYNMGVLVSSEKYLYFCDSDRNICTILDKKPFTGTLTMSGIVCKSFFPNLCNANVVDGKFDGEISLYYNAGKKPSIAVVAKYNKGELTGEYREYYEDSIATTPHGQLEYKAYYADGKRNGLAQWYYKNGEIKSEYNYVNGKKNGISHKWDENGTLISLYNYADDLEDGAFEEHCEDGTHTKGIYKEGVKISSVSCRYYPNGELKSLVEERGSDKVVRKEEYDENGNII